MTLALPDYRTLAVGEAHDWCRRVVVWAGESDDIDALTESLAWTNAIEKYLSHKDAESPAQAASRLTEARIGGLLGDAPGRGRAEMNHRADSFHTQTRKDWRRLHQNRNLWESLALAALEHGTKHNLSRARLLRLIRDDEADMRPIAEKPAQLLSDLYLGDFREVLNNSYYDSQIPNESIDLILTDPPYPAEFLPLWSDLAKFAKRVLSPTGVLAAMSGQVNLPEVYQRLGEHLPYRWTMAYLMAGSANVVHARRVSTMWKPVLIYGSNQRRLYDVATSKAADKDYHGWGQSESGFYDLIRLLADPGDTVCDPFLGGGTTAIVARAYGCHFIGAESDPVVFATAEARLAA